MDQTAGVCKRILRDAQIGMPARITGIVDLATFVIENPLGAVIESSAHGATHFNARARVQPTALTSKSAVIGVMASQIEKTKPRAASTQLGAPIAISGRQSLR